ncbi:hypothetical protein FJ659_01555 [Bacillus dicomae]|uniref:Uncharacterized protein n=1 Tax=Bacillus dicomae TaxID=3088378 RepID=A0AC61T8P8_9BACI|nr:hypothetical protein FJ659_01555 [Bacillus dicomae]
MVAIINHLDFYMDSFEGAYVINKMLLKKVRSGYLKKLIISCLLATFFLNIVGCSNSMGTLRDKSKNSSSVKSKHINKAWYKHMLYVIV